MLTLLFWASLDWAWIGQFGVFQLLDESLFWLQLAMSGFCRRLFYKVGARGGYWLFVSSCWTRQFRSFFFSFFFTLNSCDIRTSLFGFGVIKAQPAAECVFLLKLSREHIPVCVHIVQYTVKRGGVQFALYYRKWRPLSICVRVQQGIMGTNSCWKAAVVVK